MTVPTATTTKEMSERDDLTNPRGRANTPEPGGSPMSARDNLGPRHRRLPVAHAPRHALASPPTSAGA